MVFSHFSWRDGHGHGHGWLHVSCFTLGCTGDEADHEDIARVTQDMSLATASDSKRSSSKIRDAPGNI